MIIPGDNGTETIYGITSNQDNIVEGTVNAYGVNPNGGNVFTVLSSTGSTVNGTTIPGTTAITTGGSSSSAIQNGGFNAIAIAPVANPNSTTTTVSASSPIALQGSPVTLTSTVAAATTSLTPGSQDSVIFSIVRGSTTYTSAPVPVTASNDLGVGFASIVVSSSSSFLANGSPLPGGFTNGDVVTASFTPGSEVDANSYPLQSSSSPSFTEQVVTVNTTTTVTPKATVVGNGAPVSLTATVTASASPAGSVIFYSNGQPIAAAALTVGTGGTSTATVVLDSTSKNLYTFATSGNYNLTASYSGNVAGQDAGSTSSPPVVLTIGSSNTTTTVSVSPNPGNPLVKSQIGASVTSGTSLNTSSEFIGESFTPTSPVPETGISFNFYSNTPATTAVAFGTGYILNQPYLGTPGALGTSTPGFMGSAAASKGTYYFGSAFVLQPGVQYYFYENAAIASGTISVGATYAGGDDYLASSASSNFTQDASSSGNANFLVKGTALFPLVNNNANPIVLTATVTTPSGASPTGSVQFFDNGTSLGSATVVLARQP